ncbi:MAG: NifU family protein [Bacteroidetes bacterium]|jgi:Fe-S cluster biogenesis protein NfuA|nr:NifU family protein [Bacteroidota bacterium]
MSPAQSLFDRVQAALDTIRPYLEGDGGNVELLEVNQAGEVRLRLIGNCEQCNISQLTLRNGIEKVIRQSVPEITLIESIPPSCEHP